MYSEAVQGVPSSQGLHLKLLSAADMQQQAAGEDLRQLQQSCVPARSGSARPQRGGKSSLMQPDQQEGSSGEQVGFCTSAGRGGPAHNLCSAASPVSCTSVLIEATLHIHQGTLCRSQTA